MMKPLLLFSLFLALTTLVAVNAFSGRPSTDGGPEPSTDQLGCYYSRCHSVYNGPDCKPGDEVETWNYCFPFLFHKQERCCPPKAPTTTEVPGKPNYVPSCYVSECHSVYDGPHCETNYHVESWQYCFPFMFHKKERCCPNLDAFVVE